MKVWVEKFLEFRSLFVSRNIAPLLPSKTAIINFDVLLTVHLSIFILVINQLVAQNLFYNKFISCLYMFRASCAHRQEVKIVLNSLLYHHTCRWPSSAQVVNGTATYRCDDTRCCVKQFWPPDDEHMILETCTGMKLTYCKTNFVHQVG